MQPLSPDDPARLGPFRVEARLGAGGMGQVYLARDDDGRTAAVKVIHPHLAADPQFRARFAREIDTVRRVHTPWTAAVLSADPHGPRPWLATEFIPGPSLDQVVTSTGPLPDAAVRHLAHHLARALAALHAAGVVHRDLKPSNVLLADDGPRLIDFGIARAIDSTTITHTGHTLGTPAYMSPEQALGNDAHTPSDVFSLAAVLTYAATTTPPFGHTANAVAMLLRITDDEPDISGVPETLRPVLAECLAKDPAARPTAQQLVERLAPLVPEDAQRPLATKVWPDARLPTLVQPAEHVPTEPVLAGPGPFHAPPPHAYGPYPPYPVAPPPKGGWRPWMTVLNGALAALLLVAWLVYLIEPLRAAAPAGPPVHVAAPPPTSRVQPLATVQLGNQLDDVTVSPDGRLAYVTGLDGVTVIDTATRAATANLVLPGSARAVAFSPDSSRAYVTLLAGFVTVLDTRANAAVAQIPVGGLPQEVLATPDGRTVYCVNSEDGTVSAIDTATNTVVSTIPVAAGADFAALTPDGRSLCVYGRATSQFSVVDTATNTVTASIPIETASAIAFAPDGSRGYVLASGGITVVDPARRTVVGEAYGFGSTFADVAVTPDGRHLLVAGAPGDPRELMEVVDTATFFVVDKAPIDGPGGAVALTGDGTTAFVVGFGGSAVSIIDVSAYRG